MVRFQPSENFIYNRANWDNFFSPGLGAGISVSAGIPDFRSESGLFQTLKRDNPKEALTSGRDLFDASVFNVSRIRPLCLSSIPPDFAQTFILPRPPPVLCHMVYSPVVMDDGLTHVQ